MTRFHDLTQRTSHHLAPLRRGIPETMQSFSAMAKAALHDGVLSKKTKELIALAIAVSQRCDDCIGFHVQTLVKLGATPEEIHETLGMAVYMGGGPALMYAAHAQEAYAEFQTPVE